MATKNLARTAIEGGRLRNDEHFRTRAERQQARVYCDPANDFEARPAPRRDKGLGSSFTDHLKPIERYLRANAGRPWNKVYSELCKRFDRRTLRGQHILEGHITRHMVVLPPGCNGWLWVKYPPTSGAWVDAHGILRYTQWSKRRR